MEDFQQIYSFDGFTSVNGTILRPDRYRDLFSAMSEGHFVPRGAGVSYALASAGEGVKSISSSRFNRVLSFDAETGILEVECGAAIGDVLRVVSGRNWWLPVLPGHPSITIGGCIAFNVHGKSQYHSGCFADHLLQITVYHPQHGLLDCSPSSNKEVFDLTIGGLGLTGFIVRAKLQCQKLRGNRIQRRSIRVGSLLEASEVMRTGSAEGDQLYSWNNLNIIGSKFGRGFVFIENFVDGPKFSGRPKFGKLIFPPRRGVIERLLAPLLRSRLAAVYELTEVLKPKVQEYDLFSGAFPISGKEIYHRLLGTKGLIECQFIVPYGSWEKFVKKLSVLFAEERVPTSLGSLKLFSGKQKYLNFVDQGYCVSFDMPSSEPALRLAQKVDQLLVEFGCISNVSKDSRLSRETVEKTYKEFESFKEAIKSFDPAALVRSELRERLGL